MQEPFDVHDQQRLWHNEEEIDAAAMDEEARATEMVEQGAPAATPTQSLLPYQCSWCGFVGHTRKTKTQCPSVGKYQKVRLVLTI